MVYEDGTLALVARTGRAVWIREEALSAVGEAVFLDLPAPSPQLEAEQRSSAPSLADRIHLEILSAKVPARRDAPSLSLSLFHP